jgi:hypothetical protein
MKPNLKLKRHISKVFPKGSTNRHTADRLLSISDLKGEGDCVILVHNNEVDSSKWMFSIASADDPEFWWNSFPTLERARKWCEACGFKVIALQGYYSVHNGSRYKATSGGGLKCISLADPEAAIQEHQTTILKLGDDVVVRDMKIRELEKKLFVAKDALDSIKHELEGGLFRINGAFLTAEEELDKIKEDK